MGWDRVAEIVLVIGPKEDAATYIAHHQPQHRDRVYVWAHRWGHCVGHNPAKTGYVLVGEWPSEEHERAYFWCKDHGYIPR